MDIVSELQEVKKPFEDEINDVLDRLKKEHELLTVLSIKPDERTGVFKINISADIDQVTKRYMT